MITQNHNRGNGVSPNLFSPYGEEHRNLAVKVENVKEKNNTRRHTKSIAAREPPIISDFFFYFRRWRIF